MEPRIQYARTADGVSIAFWEVGEGPPLVWMPFPLFTDIRMEWDWPTARRAYEGLAARRRLIRYDSRGSGLSDREVADFSLEAHVLDLQAVVGKLRLERTALVAPGDAGPIAVSYAARNPERITRLVLWASYARGGFGDLAEIQAMHALMERDWQLFTETMARTAAGWSNPELGGWFSQLLARCTTPEAMKAHWNASYDFDVTDLLPRVLCPTLVIHPNEVRYADLSQARLLASQILDARLTVLEGLLGPPQFDEGGATLALVDEFLSEGEEAAPQPLPSGMTAILFADIADSTGLTERLGDAAFREKARALDGALRDVIRENGGTPVEGKLLGDGVLAVFTSARQAIAAALACGAAGASAGMPLHLGLHAGDVIREEDPDGRGNVYGGAVNIAARISALSAPGEVLVSDTLRGLARTSAGVSFEDRGERELKGVGEPVRVLAVVASPNQQTSRPANQGE